MLTYFNRIALRKAKNVCIFGLSECNRIKVNRYTLLEASLHLFIFCTISQLGSTIKRKDLPL